MGFAVSVIELAIKSVALDRCESPEEYEKASNWPETEKDLPASVLVGVDQYFDVHYDYDRCKDKIAIQGQTAKLSVKLFSPVNRYECQEK